MSSTSEKKYFWLKLKEDFFSSKRIKKLRKMAGGDTYTIIYLKMQLLSLKTDGILKYTGLEDNFASELALDIDESPEDVHVVLMYLASCGLIETSDDVNFLLPYVVENTGKETDAAQRMREMRKRNNVTPALRECYTEKEIDRERELEKELERDTPPKSPSRGNEGEMLEEAFGYNQYLLDAVKDWLAYKKEKRQGYGERGLKSLLTQLKNRVAEYGEDAVIEVIQESMAANYMGITWDKLKNQNRQQKPSGGYSFMDILKQEEKNESHRNS